MCLKKSYASFFLVDPCITSPCLHGGACDGATGTAICTCDPDSGYTGTTCDADINECDISHECVHSSICMNVPGTYECDCSGTGYVGMRCEIGLKIKHCIKE